MIIYRFTIDGNVISEPDNIQGWDKLLTSVKRDDSSLKGLLVSQDVTLTFVGSQYTFFNDLYFNSGICTEVTALIEQSFDGGVNFSKLHRGIIKTRDIKLDLLKGEATVKVNDDSFYARINNNKSIGTNPKAGSSKNIVNNITACPQYTVQLYRPIDCDAIHTRQMLSFYDVMEYLVRFMSDDEVGFQSDFLQDDLQMMIQSGVVLRTNVNPQPYWEVSFETLYKFLRSKRDVGFVIEYDTNDKPILRLELASYFYADTTATGTDGQEIIFLNPEKLTTEVKVQELYSKLKLGTSIIADFPYLTYPVSTRYNGFKEEELYVLGQCNIDNTLDLSDDIIVSTNAIEDIVIGASQDYDDELIVIVVENLDTGLHTADAKMSNPFGASPPCFYNMDLLNSKTANSYFGVLQNGLVAGFLTPTSNDFRGLLTAVNSTIISPPYGFGVYAIDPLIYQTEIDPGANFNPATGYYTCPADGFYTFNFYIKVDMPGAVNADVPGNFLFRIVDDASNVLGESTLTPALHYGNTYTGLLSVNIFRNAGDKVGTSVYDNYFVTYPNTEIRILPGTYFEASSSPDTGGVVQSYDPQDIRGVLMKFDYKITPRNFNAILANLRGKYTIQSTVLNKIWKGWIEEIKYNHKSEIANITLKTSINSID